jgi:formylglycine-generating enzyme required for sulfatase activity
MYSQLRQAAQLWVNHQRSDGYLWSAERLMPVYEMLERRRTEDIDILVGEFIQPEQERLLAELEDINTSHLRRSVIGDRLAYIGDSRTGVGLRKDGLPDIVWCPAVQGEITISLRSIDTPQLERKVFQFSVAPFYIVKYPITDVQFQTFLDDQAMGFNHDQWWQGLEPRFHKVEVEAQTFKYNNHPRDSVTWHQAVAYCRWLTAMLPREAWPLGAIPVGKDWIIRLPTEWEWQQAATGRQNDYRCPWGGAWDERRGNTRLNGIGHTMAVGMYPEGASPAPTLALDMVGNVSEWCLNLAREPASVNIGGDITSTNPSGEENWDRVLRSKRGASFNDHPHAASAVERDQSPGNY